MKHGYAIWLVLLILVLASVLIFALANDITEVEPPDTPMQARPYNAVGVEGGTVHDEAYLNERTEILGEAVYDENGEILGSLYDAYINVRTGQVQWISVDVTAMRPAIENTFDENESGEAELVLIPLAKIAHLGRDGSEQIRLRLLENDFRALPAQKTVDERLETLVSLRSLPGKSISDLQGRDVGAVEGVSYHNGYADMVYFTAQQSAYNSKRGVFSIPFTALIYSETVNDAGTSDIKLTERQAGAVEMALRQEDNDQ